MCQIKWKSHLLFSVAQPLPCLWLWEGRGELGAAFAAEHSNNSKAQRNELAVLSQDGGILLLPWEEDNHLLPLTKCKHSHGGSSSKL